ncbi:MAG: type I-F CRISPR-associated protein Csy2 [Methylococcales bacterium]|nr:type I-F CRISPR-associated protein Csy2 [Methylococcales bacterium]MDD5753270.1 type I-F CRISPR-associated protein Csy2 [Methylococcales bacterium]
MSNLKTILLIPHLKIQNANALSSPYTIGFPAMTAWLGAVHALQRKLNQAGFEQLKFKSVGVACHDLNLQTHKGRSDYVHSIISTGNPLDKDGSRPAFIEEARCHLDVSLIVECENFPCDETGFLHALPTHVHQLKLASGDILDFSEVDIFKIDNEASRRTLMRKLMPSYVIIERRELMIEAMKNGQNAIDALLDYLTVKHRSIQTESGECEWTQKRKTSGWIVPIATGFQGISALGKAENQRDLTMPHRFAESVVTLGEFVMPHRIKTLDRMLWRYHVDLENDLYLCKNLPISK